jgi:Fe-S-cluster-containing hydrogenase component 2
MDPQKEELVKCDLCGGQPQCVEWCPTGAIRFVAANIPDLPQAYQKTNSEQQP